jgi:hypothetical protein
VAVSMMGATSPSLVCLDAAGAHDPAVLVARFHALQTLVYSRTSASRLSAIIGASSSDWTAPPISMADPSPKPAGTSGGNLRVCPQRCAANQVRASATVADGGPIQAHARQRAVNLPRSNTM